MKKGGLATTQLTHSDVVLFLVIAHMFQSQSSPGGLGGTARVEGQI